MHHHKDSQFDGLLWVNSLTKNYSRSSLLGSSTLFRIDKFLNTRGSRHKKDPIIHIAGSKGKSSTALYIAGTLQKMGYQVLLFTSPHVFQIRERILLNNEFLPTQIWDNLLEEIYNYYQDFLPQIGYFDALVLLVFLIQRDLKPDWLILETGIGGRLDTTNLCLPKASVITRIEKEHVQLLGNTLTQIAQEKAGIIKKTIPTFSAVQDQNVLQILKHKSHSLKSLFFYLPDYGSIQSTYSDKVQWQTYYTGHLLHWSFQNLKPKMLGSVQMQNALLALLVLQKTLKTQLEQVRKCWELCVETASLPGRFQRFLIKNRYIVLDGSHTIESFKHAVNTWKQYVDGGTLVFSCQPDKNWKGMIRFFEPFTHLFLTGHEDWMQNIFNQVKILYPQTLYFKDVKQAWQCALNTYLKNPILVSGSFYLLQKIKSLW